MHITQSSTPAELVDAFNLLFGKQTFGWTAHAIVIMPVVPESDGVECALIFLPAALPAGIGPSPAPDKADWASFADSSDF